MEVNENYSRKKTIVNSNAFYAWPAQKKMRNYDAYLIKLFISEKYNSNNLLKNNQ